MGSKIDDFLKNPSKLTTINDIYYGYLLQIGAKEYGAKHSETFDKFLLEKATSEWIKNFNAKEWSISNSTA